MTMVRHWVACGLLELACRAQTPPSLRAPAPPPARSPALTPAGSAPRVIGLAMGTFFSCALSSTGRLRCWGDDSNGVLGYPERRDIGDDERPADGVDVPIGQPVTSVAGGLRHACAVTQSGDVACWGRWKPIVYRPGWQRTVDLVSRGSSAVQVAAGSSHTCALLVSGGIRCWGQGKEGALGYGNPSDVWDDNALNQAGDVPIGGRALQVVAGNNLTCALLESRAVRCWGSDGIGYPHKARVGTDETPMAMGDVAVGGPVKELAAGGGHVCALLVDGTVRCWGSDALGELGYGDEIDVGEDEPPSFAGVVNVGAPVLQLTAGLAHTCALMQGGRVRCWGGGESGRLGYGNTSNIGDDEKPFSAGDVDVGGEVSSIAAGGFHTCALLKDGCVRCWGLGEHGQLGYGNKNNIGDDETPASAGCVSVFEK